MKNIKIYGVLLLGLTLASCQKFVDIKRTNTQINLGTVKDCQLMLDNYVVMNTNYPVDGEISADDYYINDNTYQTNTTISTEEKRLYIWDAGAQRAVAALSWQSPYKTIYISNLVLEALQKLPAGTTDFNSAKGAALFYRAYCFWQVAQLYAKPYLATTAATDPGIPLRFSSDINGKSSRGTVQDTYNQILKDLQEALSLLQPTSSVRTRPNKAAAYAMLARVYLSMEDYPNAGINANEAISLNGNLLDYNSPTVNTSPLTSTPFVRYNVEVIFQTLGIYQGFAPTAGTILAPGSAASSVAKIDPVLAASYNVNDIRSKVFLKANSGADAGTFRFTGNYEPAFSPTFFTGLAVDEMYLTRAECYARAGKLTEAMTDLNKLLKNRWVTSTYTDQVPGAPDDVLRTILLERRKELLMRGLRWTDLRRLNRDARFKKDLSRTVTVNAVSTTYTLPANDPKYTLLIPQEVMTYGGIAQNIR